MTTRISTSQIFHNAQAHVAEARSKETTSSEKAASLKEIVRPSQNPSAWTQAATLKDDLSARETIAKNASLAMHTLSTSEAIISQMTEYVQRAHEIALSCAGTDMLSDAARAVSSADMRGIYEGAIQTLNTRYANRTLLAGLRTQDQAFDPEGNYLGDGQDFNLEISRDLIVPINVSGARAILGEGIPDGINILQTFRDLKEGLENDSAEQVGNTLDRLMAAVDQLSLVRSEIAGRMSQIERALTDHETTSIQAKEAISKIEDADAIKIFSDLARDQAVLQASVKTSQKILSENAAAELFK